MSKFLLAGLFTNDALLCWQMKNFARFGCFDLTIHFIISLIWLKITGIFPPKNVALTFVSNREKEGLPKGEGGNCCVSTSSNSFLKLSMTTHGKYDRQRGHSTGCNVKCS